MKKYTSEHFEKIEAHFIICLEKVIDCDKPCKKCPLKLIPPYLDCTYEFGRKGMCSTIFKYHGQGCACHHFGPDQAIKEAINLVDQWKSWAGIED